MTEALARLLAVASIAGVPICCAQESPSPDPMSVQPGSYKLESTHARVIFSVSHLGFSTWYGEFTRPTGTARLDSHQPETSVLDITIPVANISTSNTTLDGELRSADWFDAAKYPTITYKSKSVTPKGPGEYEVLGDLTMHGVTRPVTLNAKFNMAGLNMMTKNFTAGYDATARIHRSDFGITKYVGAIGDEVTIQISAPFEKAK